MIWEQAVTSLFWFSVLATILAFADMALLYCKETIKKKWLLVHGILLVIVSATILGGFGFTLDKIDYWLPHAQGDLDTGILIWLKVGLSNLRLIVPLSIAAVGSFLITKAVGENLRVVE